MKRRGFLKFLGIAAAAPVAASLPLPAEPKPVRTHKPIPDSAWETERNIRQEMNGATMAITFNPSDLAASAQRPMYILTENAKPLRGFKFDKDAAEERP